VSVENNRLALALGRLAAADADSLARLLRDEPAAVLEDESLETLVARGVAHLTGYQDAAYARRFHAAVQKVLARERELDSDPSLPLTRTFARSLLKLMSYKDEYEVARLYTDGEFTRALRQQFEGDVALEFYMAPPALSRAKAGQAPRKLRLGGWMLPAMKLLAQGRRLRGSFLDVFGRTEERRLERALIAGYLERIDALLPALTPERLRPACEIAALPLSMRGFGHVKLANVALARAREAELLHRFDPATYARPAPVQAAGQIRGIRVTAAV
jgi:indolepyruvate ferredoxin oxidoreductase